MKIAYVSNTRFPSERANSLQIVHMCNAFSANGCDVNLLVSSRSTGIVDTPETYYGTILHFKITKLSVFDLTRLVLKVPKLFWSILYAVQRISFLVSFVILHTSNKYTVVYGRDEWILWMASFFTPKTHIIWESHEAKYNFPARRLLARCKNVVVISEGIKDAYVKLGHKNQKFVIAHDAVDITFFQPLVTKALVRAKLGISGPKKVLLYIGGLDRWKGVETLFEASLLLDDVQVVIIGGKEHQISRFTKKYPKILFLGAMPYRDLPANQQAADILIIPNTAKNNLSSKYTSPLKLFAYMTSKIPIILSDIPSLRAIVSDQEGTFYTPDDPVSLAKSVILVLNEYTRAEEKAIQAFEISKRYTWDTRAEHILSAIHQN